MVATLKLLFSKHLTIAVCVSCRKILWKVLHDGNSLIKMYACLYCTSIMRLGILLMSICVYFDYDFSRIKVIKNISLR